MRSFKTGQVYFSFVSNCLCPFKSALYSHHWAFGYLPDNDEVLCSNKCVKILSWCIFCAICEMIMVRRDRQTDMEWIRNQSKLVEVRDYQLL